MRKKNDKINNRTLFNKEMNQTQKFILNKNMMKRHKKKKHIKYI